MVVPTRDLVETDPFSLSTMSKYSLMNDQLSRKSHISYNYDSEDMPQEQYKCIPGLFRKEAIMLLRKFYLRENKQGTSQIILLKINDVTDD